MLPGGAHDRVTPLRTRHHGSPPVMDVLAWGTSAHAARSPAVCAPPSHPAYLPRSRLLYEVDRAPWVLLPARRAEKRMPLRNREIATTRAFSCNNGAGRRTIKRWERYSLPVRMSCEPCGRGRSSWTKQHPGHAARTRTPSSVCVRVLPGGIACLRTRHHRQEAALPSFRHMAPGSSCVAARTFSC